MGEPQVTAFTFGPKNKRGICSVCSKPAYKGSATKCNDHRKSTAASPKARPQASSDTTTISPEEMASVAGESRAPRVEIPTGGTAPNPATLTGDAKKDKAAEYKRRILSEGNVAIVKGFAQVCKPVPSEMFYLLDAEGFRISEVSQTLLISEFEAGILAKAAVELEASPVVAMGSAAAAPVMPYLLGFAALGIVGFHALTAMQMRQQVIDRFKAQVAANAAGGPVEAPTEPVTPTGVEDMQPEATATILRPPFTEQTLVEQATN